jgi:hypothetical protein
VARSTTTLTSGFLEHTHLPVLNPKQRGGTRRHELKRVCLCLVKRPVLGVTLSIVYKYLHGKNKLSLYKTASANNSSKGAYKLHAEIRLA